MEEMEEMGEMVEMGEKKNINPMDYPNELFELYSIPAYQNGHKPELELGKKIFSQKILLKTGMVLFAPSQEAYFPGRKA